MQKLFFIFVFLFAFNAMSAEKSSGGGSSGKAIDDPVKKAENRYNDRWTLADWFETKRKANLQDQWLSTRMSSNPYEFYIGGDHGSFDRLNRVTDTTVAQTQSRAYFGAYASLVGLEGQMFSSDEKSNGWNAQFLFRLLGKSVQTTNITLHYGLKNREEDFDPTTKINYQIQYAGVTMDLYLIKLFGVGGMYRKYFENSEKLDLRVGGERVEGQVFIDYSFLRIYGKYFREPTIYLISGSKTTIESTGILAGATIFF